MILCFINRTEFIHRNCESISSSWKYRFRFLMFVFFLILDNNLLSTVRTRHDIYCLPELLVISQSLRICQVILRSIKLRLYDTKLRNYTYSLECWLFVGIIERFLSNFEFEQVNISYRPWKTVLPKVTRSMKLTILWLDEIRYSWFRLIHKNL